MKFDKRLERLENRRNDPQFLYKSFSADSASAILNEAYKTIPFPESVRYTVGAMQEVGKTYTANTVAEGERIKNQLESLKNDGYSFSFRFQGSTTNNTHILAHSDIDLLVVQEKFQFNASPGGGTYTGNWKLEQSQLRSACYTKIQTVFYTANVDNSGKYSINVTGGSLKRKVDIVPSCWDITNKYLSDPKDYNKGIRVFDARSENPITNYPFYNNQLIEDKDLVCSGNFRKAVRLVKTLKADSERNLEVSSYDITSLLYHMSNAKYLVGNQLLAIVRNIREHFTYYCNNPLLFASLPVADGTRKISDKLSLENLKGLTVEVAELEASLVEELAKVAKSIDVPIIFPQRLYG